MTPTAITKQIPLPGNGMMVVSGVTLDAVSYLDTELLGASGMPKPLPSAMLLALDPLHLRLWMHRRAIYCYPTLELVAFVRRWVDRVASPEKALEIGAGCSGLGFHVGVRRTDSYVQVDDPSVAAYYALTRQPPVQPLPGVIKASARAAVRNFRPQAVFGSWITQCKPDKAGLGSDHGPDEVTLLKRVKHYLHVGTDTVHGSKHINDLPHELLRFPWIVSRTSDPAANHIRIWGG